MAAPDFFILAYDIADDKRRAKIAKLMESMGARVQGSVFEAYLAPADLETLLRRVGKVLKKDQDSLRVYFVCASCRARVRAVGLGQVTSPPTVTII